MATATYTYTITGLSSSPPHSIFLTPAKSRRSILLLLPLLPVIHLPPLPVELWARIISFALYRDERDTRREEDEKWRWGMARVSRWWKRVALPELYSSPYLPNLPSFTALLAHLHTTDSHWSPLHRTPYSLPAGWIRTLDLSNLPPHLTAKQLLSMNSTLLSLWPMLPGLEDIRLRQEWQVCAGVVRGLGEACRQLRRVRGVSWKEDRAGGGGDPVVSLLKACRTLEEVEIYGPGLSAYIAPSLPWYNDELLRLDHLHTLTLIGLPASPFLSLLILSPLPALRTLTLTPYYGEAGEQCTPFLLAHGAKLDSLSFARGPEWPSLPLSPPSHLLTLCPSLSSLSLIHPLPAALDPPACSRPGSGVRLHPLARISLPRPLVTAEYKAFLRTGIPYDALPALKELRLTDFRWLKALGRAGDTGARRGMAEAAAGLRKRGVRVVDCEGVTAV